MTFLVLQAAGGSAPAYARHIGTTGNNFLSNRWRADSESGVGDFWVRIAPRFAGRMSDNTFAEFWPDARKRLFRQSGSGWERAVQGASGQCCLALKRTPAASTESTA